MTEQTQRQKEDCSRQKDTCASVRVAVCRSAALTKYDAGPIVELCTMLAETWSSEDVEPLFVMQCVWSVKKIIQPVADSIRDIPLYNLL